MKKVCAALSLVTLMSYANQTVVVDITNVQNGQTTTLKQEGEFSEDNSCVLGTDDIKCCIVKEDVGEKTVTLTASITVKDQVVAEPVVCPVIDEKTTISLHENAETSLDMTVELKNND